MYIWLVVDRLGNKVVDFEVSQTRGFDAYLCLAYRLVANYRINQSYSDYYKVYGKYKIAQQHKMTKAETSRVESKNSLIRHYFARLNRCTKHYSKALDMIWYSIFMIFIKNFTCLPTGVCLI